MDELDVVGLDPQAVELRRYPDSIEGDCLGSVGRLDLLDVGYLLVARYHCLRGWPRATFTTALPGHSSWGRC